MHQIELKCVAHGWPDVRIFWRKAGEEMDAETYLFDNQGTARKVSAVAMVCQQWRSLYQQARGDAFYKLTIFGGYNLFFH